MPRLHIIIFTAMSVTLFSCGGSNLATTASKISDRQRQTKSAGISEPVIEQLAGGLAWEKTSESLALLKDGKAIWQSNHKIGVGKPCIHPLRTLDGTDLSEFRPDDHTWHRGMWFTWKFINGLNYWEENPEGLSPGATEIISVKTDTDSKGEAIITLAIKYYPHPHGDKEVVREKRTITITPPNADDSYSIDWKGEFTATGDTGILLDRTPIIGEKGRVGYAHGGYAGFSLRMAKSTRGWNFMDSNAAVDPRQMHGKTAKWIYSYADNESVSDGRIPGVVIFDHPQNFNHPSRWYVNDDMPYVSPACIYQHPRTFPKYTSFELRYTVLVTGKELTKEQIDVEWRKFVYSAEME